MLMRLVREKGSGLKFFILILFRFFHKEVERNIDRPIKKKLAVRKKLELYVALVVQIYPSMLYRDI
jgi:hypothetical protein